MSIGINEKCKTPLAAILCVWLVAALVLCSCSDKRKSFDTKLAFSEDKFQVVSEDYAICFSVGKTRIYKINHGKGTLSDYYLFNKNYKLSDVSGNNLLLTSADEQIVFNVTKRKITKLKSGIDKDCIGSMDGRFSGDGKSVIQTVTANNKNEPMYTGKTFIGYPLAKDSGIYAYSLNGKNTARYGIEKFGIEDLDINAEISFSVLNSGKIGVVIKTAPLGTTFYGYSYCLLNTDNAKVEKIGARGGFDTNALNTAEFFFDSRYVTVTDGELHIADFDLKRCYGKKISGDTDYLLSRVLFEESSKFFVIENGTQSGSEYIKCTFKNGGITCRSVKSKDVFQKTNYILLGDSVLCEYLPAKNNISFGKNTGTVYYKTYCDGCFVTTNSHKKISVVYVK